MAFLKYISSRFSYYKITLSTHVRRNLMKIGERMSELRKDRGLKQKEIAEVLNVAVSTVSNYETDSHEPDLTNLCKLADLLGVSTDYLLGRTDIKENMNVLKEPIHDTITKEEVIHMMEYMNKEDCAYLAKTLHLLYSSHLSKNNTKNQIRRK